MSPPRWQRALLALLMSTVAIILWPGTAQAADTVPGGRLDWGLKSSFSTYITGPIANGSILLGGGAGTVGTDQYRFHSATGQYDSSTGDFTAAYSGSVQFVGHQRDDGSYELDLTLANPTVSISGGAGTLYVDMNAHGSVSNQVAFGTLELGGMDTSGASGSVAISDIPVTLTAEGAQAFEGFYEAGQALDPLSLTGDLTGASEPSETPSDDDEKASDEEFDGATFDWGVRRTFREFVVGDIAQGQWQVSDGAQDGGAVFRFVDGKGELTEDALEAQFTGTLTFTGNDLDLAITDPAVLIEDGEGVITATVVDAGEPTEDVELVTFETGDLEPEDGLLWLSEVPAVLTEDGSKALADFYPAGTEMDPISVAVPMADGVELPPLPDIGEDPVDAVAPEPVADNASDDDASSPFVWIVIGVIVAAAATGLVIWLLRRRKPTTAERSDKDGTDPPSKSEPSEDKSVPKDTPPEEKPSTNAGKNPTD